MRTLLFSICLTTLSAHSLADNTLGCASGVLHSAIPVVDNLRNSSDKYVTSQCFFTPELRPGKNTWLFALPALRWQQSYPSKLSRSAGSARYLRWSVRWPLARLHKHHLLFEADGGSQQLTSEFKQNTLWTPTTQLFAAQQSLQLKQTQRQLALTVKIFRPYSALNRVSIQHTELQQPISIKQRLPVSSELLTPAKLQHYALKIGNQTHRRGWNFPWQFALGHGTVKDGKGNYLATRSLRKEFNYSALQIAANYRWRLSRKMQVSAGYQWHWEYYDFADARQQDTLQTRDSSAFLQQINASLEWRF